MLTENDLGKQAVIKMLKVLGREDKLIIREEAGRYEGIGNY